MRYVIDLTFLAMGAAAIVLPWIGLRRTGRDLYRIIGILASLACGWCCTFIVVSWFIAVMPSYIFLAIPLFFVIAVTTWFACGAHAKKRKSA